MNYTFTEKEVEMMYYWGQYADGESGFMKNFYLMYRPYLENVPKIGEQKEDFSITQQAAEKLVIIKSYNNRPSRKVVSFRCRR